MKNRIYLKHIRLNLWLPIIFVFWGVFIYFNTFHSPFVFDDEFNIVGNPNIRNIFKLGNIWSYCPTRFITYLSFAVNYYFNHLRVFGYHMVNIFIHIGTAILVWLFTTLTLVTPAMKDKEIARHKNLVAFFVSFIFLAHPIQTQGITYITQRAASLATLFYLASLTLYVKSRLLEYERSNSRARMFYYAGSLILAVLAMFAKEISITLPLMVLLYEFCFFKTKKGINWKQLIPFLVTLLIIPIMMQTTKPVDTLTFADKRQASILEELGPGISSGEYLLTQFRVMVTYLRLLFIPINQNLDYDYPIAKSLTELPVLASLLLLAFILIIAIRIFPRYRLVSFSIFWFFLTLLPESSIIPIKDVIFEHRLYLPMVGYSIFLVTLAYNIYARKNLKVMGAVLGIILMTYSLLTLKRNAIWKDGITLWLDTVNKSCGKARPYNNLGHAYDKHGEYDKAIIEFNRALQRDSSYADAYNNRGCIYIKKGDYNRAISDFNQALRADIDHAEAYSNRALAYVKKKEYAKALADVKKALEINPLDSFAHNISGDIYASLGNNQKAKELYERALSLDPDSSLAYSSLGSLYGRMGEHQKAITLLLKAAKVDPRNSEVFMNLGCAFGALGDYQKAIEYSEKALSLDPNLALAYANLGVAYYFSNRYDLAVQYYNKAIKLGLVADPGFIKLLDRYKK